MTIRLQSLIEEKIEEVDSNEASELLFTGAARLHGNQRMPAVEFVNALIERTGNVEGFGERAARSADLDRISSALTPTGVSQNMVKREEIPLVTSGAKVLLGAETKLDLTAPDGFSLVAAAQNVPTRYRKHNPQTDKVVVKYLAKRIMENRRPRDQSDSPEWENSIARLTELQQRTFAGIKRGLLEGRILCTQIKRHGSGLKRAT
ncbi:hypothetical protein ACOTTU_19980 [Roseobacter sp. EG26]|uniref:hypothetical protein n=1 Tax=Roseobacter sp. EG26 TaxID=3412477 RepID=UPI003CE52964